MMAIRLSALAGLSLIGVIQSLPCQAYPQVEMNACIFNATKSVFDNQLKATLADVKKYCHCGLSRIIDQGKPIAASLNYCNQVYILNK